MCWQHLVSMRALTGLIILCLAGIQLVQCQTDTIDLSEGTATVTEGTDTSINVVCMLNGGVALTRDAVCGLGIETGVTGSAENGYDVSDVTEYTCTISAGDTSGSVDIPIIDDFAIDDAEILGITCATPSSGDTAGTTASFTLSDGGNTDAQLTIVPRNTFYKITEGGNLEIVVDVLDSNGDAAPNEENIDIQLVFPTQLSSDTAATTDYDSAVVAATLSGSMSGAATSSFTLSLSVSADTDPENLETLNVLLSDSTTATSVTSDGTTTITVFILDDDKPELVVVNDRTPVPRRTKKDFFLRAFNALGAWDSFDLEWVPFNLRDWRSQDVTTDDGIVVTKTTLPRPSVWSRARFNEYKYTTTQTINTIAYSLETFAYVSATSHTRYKAPIESLVGPTWTILPNSVDANGDCVSIENELIVVPFDPKTSRMLRWDFIQEGGGSSDKRRLRGYNGKNWIRVTDCDDAGLYIVSRRGRGQRGWVEFVHVIVGACPEGFTGPPACTTVAETCLNGGIVDPDLALCTCPPGFAGTNCETALEPGNFGSSCQFTISDIIPGNRKGKCVSFSLPAPFGVTCAAGFHGNDCCLECPCGWFGANCHQECHCVDDACDPYSGKCVNGCAPTYFGPNCQSGGPP